MRASLPACAVLAVLLGARAGAAPVEDDPVAAARRAHGRRLSALAVTARDAHLGAVALRLFQDALALAPDDEAARLALGWTRKGTTWRPPDRTVLPGAGWADDGEGELARVAKREATARADGVKDLVAAASAAKARKDVARAERCLWAALALDPTDLAVRRALGHVEQDGRAVAPEHADAAARAADVARRRGELLAAAGAADVALVVAEPPLATLPGGTAVRAGWAAASGDRAFGVDDDAPTEAVARAAGDARRLVAALWGGPERAGRPAAFLVVPSRAVADALLEADPSVDAASREAARAWPVWPLGRTGYELLVAASADEAAGLAADAVAQREVAARVRDPNAVRWLAFGAGWFVSRLVVGAPRGYGATPRVVGGDTGLSQRDGEPSRAFVRRCVAAGADRPLAELAALDPRLLHPRDVAKAGALLDGLAALDPQRARAFVEGVLSGGATAASLEPAAKAAGWDGLAALEEAWRRFALDVEPFDAPDDAGAGAWRTGALERVKAPDLRSLHGDPVHAVAGALWLAGRPWTCRPVERGEAVALAPLAAGAPDRVVRAPGVVPFAVPREYGGGSVEVRVLLERPTVQWTARAAEAVAGAVDGQPVTFVDLDLDGRFGGFDRDGVVLGKGGLVLPLRRELVLGGKLVELRRVGPDGREVAWRVRPLGAKGDDLAALLRANGWRVAAGLAPVRWDASLLAPGPVATATTRTARPAPDVAAALVALAADPASGLLDPDARAVAWRLEAGTATCVVSRGEPDLPSPFRGPAVLPGDGATDVPRTLADGTPFPLCVRFARGTDLASARVEVVLTTDDGTAVATAPRPTAPGVPVAAFAPVAPLAPGTAYRLAVEVGRGTARGRQDVRFTTAR